MGKQDDSAFGFDGGWKEYAPIAFTNLLLTIVTLGVYRFWATARTRRYLWSRTRFIDDRLEWTGTGGELFLGFIMVLLLLGLPFTVMQFGVQSLALRGYEGIASILSAAAAVSFFYFIGLARFRAVRYRLGRTFWHGIRGGSDDQGYNYGISYIWKSFVGYIPAGLLIPWSMISLWNERWNKMSFGSHQFRCDARVAPVFMRFLLFYLIPFIFGIGLIVAFLMMGGIWAITDTYTNTPPIYAVLMFLAAILAGYVLLGVIALAYYAAFLREGIGALRLERLEFGFEARTVDWLILFFGDLVLVVCTLGIGMVFIDYRHWKFFISHLEAYGEIDLDALTQSGTRLSKHGEGLLDALDVGAF